MYYFKYVLRIMTNSIFRYLPYFILGFICSFLFNSCEVQAASYGYSSGTYAIGWSGCSTSGTNCYWNSWGSQLDYGERTVKPDLDGTTYGSRMSIRVYGGNNYTYKKNNTYHFKYTFSTTSDIYNSISFWYLYQTNGNTTSSSSGQFKLDEDADVIGYKIVKNNTGDNYFDIIISISPSQDYKYFNFYLSMPIATTNLGPNTEYNDVLLIYGIPQNIQLRKLEVNYSEGVGSQIDNQTTIIQNNFNNTNDIINNVNDSIKDTNNNIKDINDSITDSSTDNSKVSNTISGVNIGNQGLITQLILMPVNLFTNILNSINGTCYEFNLGNLFGTDLKLPCINIESYVGSNLWNVIDILFSGFAIFAISKKIKQVFEQFTNLRDGDILND